MTTPTRDGHIGWKSIGIAVGVYLAASILVQAAAPHAWRRADPSPVGCISFLCGVIGGLLYYHWAKTRVLQSRAEPPRSLAALGPMDTRPVTAPTHPLGNTVSGAIAIGAVPANDQAGPEAPRAAAPESKPPSAPVGAPPEDTVTPYLYPVASVLLVLGLVLLIAAPPQEYSYSYGSQDLLVGGAILAGAGGVLLVWALVRSIAGSPPEVEHTQRPEDPDTL